MAPPARIAWEQFTCDPRSEHNARLRASDRDRDVALTALGDAFADGRLDRTEYDERSAVVQGAKHLGELVAPLRDLAADRPAPVAVPAGPPDVDHALRHRAEQRYARAREGAMWAFVIPSVVCWTIWVCTSFGPSGFEPYFPWPLFVMLGTGIRGLKLLAGDRDAMLAREWRHLERRERRP